MELLWYELLALFTMTCGVSRHNTGLWIMQTPVGVQHSDERRELELVDKWGGPVLGMDKNFRSGGQFLADV